MESIVHKDRTRRNVTDRIGQHVGGLAHETLVGGSGQARAYSFNFPRPTTARSNTTSALSRAKADALHSLNYLRHRFATRAS